ncbi:MAG TPA: Ku protein [Candidatus Acidoferrales bacterium]|jgi:DNA end-binding protein Ku|nr:Ku protein [Candidatus Acidoferrales bacterium]
MPSSTWKGYLAFGLISIPIRLSPAARTERISFNQLHKVCHTRLKQPLFCPTCDRMVERSEVEKGYEHEKGQYLLFTQEELDEVEPETAHTMEILEFVKLDEVDPVYFDASYYIAPEEAGQRAYQLLTEAMEKSGYAGIAKIAMHNREYIVVIRPREHGLTLHTMFYSNEIRAEAEYGRADKGQIKDQERTLAQQLIESLAAPFEPDKYHDTYQAGLQNLIEAKSSGRKITAMPHAQAKAPVIDLMEALKKSLAKKPAAVAEKKPSVVRAAKTERRQGRKTG